MGKLVDGTQQGTLERAAISMSQKVIFTYPHPQVNVLVRTECVFKV